MNSISKLISEKGFNPISFAILLSWDIAVLGLIIFWAVMHESNEDVTFQCQVKGEDKEYIQGLCYNNYKTEVTKGFPIYGFVSLAFILNVTVCLIYYNSVKSRIKNLEKVGVDHENQERIYSFGGRLFCRYCIQLFLRFLITAVFLILQCAIYPFTFPSTYNCDIDPSNTIENATKATYHCTTKQAANKTYVSKFLFAINILFAFIMAVELAVVLSKMYRDKKFKRDLYFQFTYLQNDHTNIDKYITDTKKVIRERTKHYKPIFPNIAGEESGNLLKLETIFTSLIVYPGREKCDFPGERQQRIDSYIIKKKENRSYFSVNGLQDILSKVPSKIMLIGRPGIGKSLLCQKICFDMASKEKNQEESFDFVYLFDLRCFKKDEKLNLRKLFHKSQFSGDFSEAVYRYILVHPEKVLLIFDGLDKIGTIRENLINEEEQSVENSPSKEMSFPALYGKLIKGTFLKGATIITTSRPTALSNVANVKFDKTLEIVGFTEDEIEQYVKNFCQHDEKNQRMWGLISGNSNLLSLCYVPAICHVVCFSLKQISKEDGELSLTEIYTKAIEYIVEKHNRNSGNGASEQERNPAGSSTSIRGFTTMMTAVVKDLGKLAYDGLESERFIFKSNEVAKYKESGLLHQLPGKPLTEEEAQFCFLHLTMQEFVAAAHIVQTKIEEDLEDWISNHDTREGKWQLVKQFIDGFRHEESGESNRTPSQSDTSGNQGDDDHDAVDQSSEPHCSNQSQPTSPTNIGRNQGDDDHDAVDQSPEPHSSNQSQPTSPTNIGRNQGGSNQLQLNDFSKIEIPRDDSGENQSSV